jgi:hypothetical protein
MVNPYINCLAIKRKISVETHKKHINISPTLVLKKKSKQQVFVLLDKSIDTKYVISIKDARAIHLATCKLGRSRHVTFVIPHESDPSRKIEVKGLPLVINFVNGEDHILLQHAEARVFAQVTGLWLKDEAPTPPPEHTLESTLKDLLDKGKGEFERARHIVGNAWYDKAFLNPQKAESIAARGTDLSKKAKDMMELMLTCELVKKLAKFTKGTPEHFDNSQFEALFKEIYAKLHFIKSSDLFESDVDYNSKVSVLEALLKDIFASAQIVKEKQPQTPQSQEMPGEQSQVKPDKQPTYSDVDANIDNTIARHGETLRSDRNGTP